MIAVPIFAISQRVGLPGQQVLGGKGGMKSAACEIYKSPPISLPIPIRLLLACQPCDIGRKKVDVSSGNSGDLTSLSYSLRAFVLSRWSRATTQ